jgi:FkbM family methyltransferase
MKKITELEFNSIVSDINNCFFIEVGANNGKDLDPLYPFIIENKWSGILVEPNPDVFKELKQNYKEIDNLFFEECVISEKSGFIDFYYNGYNYTTLHNTLSYDYAKTHFKENLRVVPTLSLTFDDLIEKYNLQKIDILMTDVEGYDLDLLKTFPFDKIKPKIIRSEYIHVGHQNHTMEEMVNFLENKGYECYNLIEGTDIIGILK